MAMGGCSAHGRLNGLAAEPAPSVAAASPSAPETVAPAAPAPANLKTIDYSPAPKGFPADPDPSSTAAVAEGLHPTTKIPVYDAPGGKPLAYLAPSISGVPLVVPIVAHKAEWVAVLLPSVNRTVGWLPSGGYSSVKLRDQLIVHRRDHRLTWLRDGAEEQSWTVTLGTSSTPTPLGRTFVLGRSALPGKVYAGVDGLALGAVPDNPNAVATGLKGAHIGIHSWYKNDFGGNKSNGCIRVPKPGQQALLDELAAGTPIVVLD
jgi:lipoprotein-anchoring transpeptidase ErfK/SrfK